MSKIYSRKKTLLAAVETTYGVPAALDGAVNAIQTSQLTISPLEGDAIELNLDKPTYGANLGTLVGKHVLCTFRVPVAGSGTAGTAPAWGVLMKGCGHKEELLADDAGPPVVVASAVYTPVDSDMDSLTFKFLQDKTLHTITGARGSLKLVSAKRDYAWFEFSFMGLYNAPTNLGTSLGAVYSSWKKPVPFRASTVDCTLFGQLVGLHSLNLDFGQKVEFYEHSEEESIQITDRRATFDSSFEETDIPTHDFFADVNSEAAGALLYKHGTVAGNIVEINAANSQAQSVKRADEQGVSALQVTGPLGAIAPDPDYTIVAR
ncbi:MAG: hypothetical protein BGP10_12420 [Rhodanobacter sp. 68-29]|nr:hypothetical protein [Rhodanobacter sp.]ODV27991.1 MAG: hypothetical protein ABT19_00340 [Rhodanobacter sp. SCN 68-63]OJY60695.1 MAG: hypothetical protein BGP10_12420 [Rhodanobacter sp. 68-29]